MTNEELIKAARHCGENRSCKECLASEKWGFGCFNFVLQGLADALEQTIKERDALLEDIKKLKEKNLAMGKQVYGDCKFCKNLGTTVCDRCGMNRAAYIRGEYELYWEWDGAV